MIQTPSAQKVRALQAHTSQSDYIGVYEGQMRKMMKHYVTGFLISADKKSVVLIRKIAPASQKGWFNGVGGKIEADETPSDAIVREFREEAGVETNASCWKHFVKLVRPDEYIVHFFVSCTDSLTNVRSMEAEPISIQAVSALPDKVLPNLRWLIPMCLDDELNFDEPIVVMEIDGARDRVETAREISVEE